MFVEADQISATIQFKYGLKDCFVSVTAIGKTVATILALPDGNRVQVLTGFDTTSDFFIFVF